MERRPFIELLCVCAALWILASILPCGADARPCGAGYAAYFFAGGIIFSLLGFSPFGWNIFERIGIAKYGSRNIVWVFILIAAFVAILINLRLSF